MKWVACLEADAEAGLKSTAGLEGDQEDTQVGGTN